MELTKEFFDNRMANLKAKHAKQLRQDEEYEKYKNNFNKRYLELLSQHGYATSEMSDFEAHWQYPGRGFIPELDALCDEFDRVTNEWIDTLPVRTSRDLTEDGTPCDSFGYPIRG